MLQMVCETLRLPFRRDVVDRMLKGMVANKPAPTLENLGQIADGLGGSSKGGSRRRTGKYFEDLAVSELVRIGTNSSTFLPYGTATCGSKEEHQYISYTFFGIALVQSSNDNQTRKEGSLD